MATRTITFANRKGGSGKTTVVVNLAAALGSLGRRVLVMDLDPQCHATYISGIDPYDSAVGIGSVIGRSLSPVEAIRSPKHGMFHVLPAYHHEERLLAVPRETGTEPLRISLAAAFDYVLIDTPPAREELLDLALSLSSEVMVPIPLQFLAMEGLAQLLGRIYLAESKRERGLPITGLIPVMADLRANHAVRVHGELKRVFGESLVRRGIRPDVRIADAAWDRAPVMVHAPRSRAAYDFHILAEEILAQEGC